MTSPANAQLVCIEYPGIVHDVDAMIKTLGGANAVANVVGHNNLRLELRFRPNDVFCKPACGERVQESSILVKVKRKRRKKRGQEEVKYETEILGSVQTTFKFESLCDFQYLPMETTSDGALKSIYEHLYFDRLVDSSWLDLPAPLFLPPAAFSRMDMPQDYQFRREATSAASDARKARAATSTETPHNIIGRTRERRSHHAIFVTFDMDKVPERARELATSQLKLKFVSSVDHEAVEKCFLDCPAWFKNALHSVTQVGPEKLKYILPTLAYYFISGPWRNQWVRFGYDPRKTTEAARLQTLDYRLRDQGGAKQKVKAKRNYASYLLPYKAVNWSKPKTSILDTDVFSSIGASDKSKKMAAATSEERRVSLRNRHQFRPGVIPTSRQTFYQFKDLMVDAAQKIIETNLKKGDAVRCDEKNGWFEPGTDQRLREVLTQEVSKQLAKEKGSEASSMPEALEEADNDTSASDSSDSDRDEERFDILAKELL